MMNICTAWFEIVFRYNLAMLDHVQMLKPRRLLPRTMLFVLLVHTFLHPLMILAKQSGMTDITDHCCIGR